MFEEAGGRARRQALIWRATHWAPGAIARTGHQARAVPLLHGALAFLCVAWSDVAPVSRFAIDQNHRGAGLPNHANRPG